MKHFVCLLTLSSLALAYPRLGDPFSPLGPWNNRGPPCGLPTFVENLPEDMQDRLRAVWVNYKEGDECGGEQMLTRDVIHELSEEVRENLIASKCGPSFLRGVPSTIRKEFRSVWFDHRLSIEAKELAFRKLAYSLLSGESLALFTKWEEELQIRKVELQQKIAALSPEAKEAYEAWKKLRLQEELYLVQLPKHIREELRMLCGWRKKPESTTDALLETTTEEIEGTTYVLDETTTVQPLIGEEAKEVEFAVFLDVSMPEELYDEAHCSFYAQ